MEVSSLEDEDYGDMFITQSSSRVNVEENDGTNSILGNEMDFASPCALLINRENVTVSQYSDISDVEDFQIPSSQANNTITR